MSSSNGTASGAGSVEAIESDIAQTRADLADTVDALSAKLDVKTRAKDSIHSVTDQVSDTVGGQVHALHDLATDDDGRPAKATIGVAGAVALAGAAIAALVVWRRTR